MQIRCAVPVRLMASRISSLKSERSPSTSARTMAALRGNRASIREAMVLRTEMIAERRSAPPGSTAASWIFAVAYPDMPSRRRNQPKSNSCGFVTGSHAQRCPVREIVWP